MDESVRWAIGIMATVGLGMFGYIMRAIGLKANKESTDKRFDALLSELKEQRQDLRSHEAEDRAMHNEVLKELRQTNQHLSMTNATLAGLSGKVEVMRNGGQP